MAEEVVDDSADSVAQLIKDAEEISDVGDASEGHFFVGRYIPTDRTEARRRFVHPPFPFTIAFP